MADLTQSSVMRLVSESQMNLIDEKLKRLSDHSYEIKTDIKEVAQALNNTQGRLDRLEQQYAGYKDTFQRAFEEISELKKANLRLIDRLEKIEKAMPSLEMVNKWVISAVIGAVTILGSGVILFYINGR